MTIWAQAHNAMKNLLPKEAATWLQAHPDALFVDVRMEIESLYVGRPPGVINVPWYDYPDLQPDADKFAATVAQEATGKNQPLLLICRSGQRTIAAGKALELRIRLEAKSISEKYIEPPYTTDFAILFLPTEGLYAEVLRRPSLMESLQRDHRITLAGPTTLLAMLSSLQMGFRTLALEKRSSEVWQVLGAVKTEFGKFGDVLSRVKTQAQTVVNTLDQAQTRSNVMHRALRNVETLTEEQTVKLLPDSLLDNGADKDDG